jgi:molybdopterin-guanine dinucleotide biosynthesis protein A
MIGSAGSNAGKTELGCAVIRRFSRDTEVVGVKVTTIRAEDGQCPRGGAGCGVCSSLEGDFVITEEMEGSSGKDTARLLKAGARRVFWLRVMKSHLGEGVACLLDVVGPDAVLVCESNSLRRVVEPGLFLLVKNSEQRVWKRSAGEVREYADRIVSCDGSGFDIDIEGIKLVEGKWGMRAAATAIIMAGGDSSRIGEDKSMLRIGGEPMIKHICAQLRPYFDQILVSCNDGSKYGFLGVEIVPDKVRGLGPLMGIATALGTSAHEVNFVVACDIPQIDMALVRMMLREVRRYEAVVPSAGASRNEPLFAVYKRSVRGAMEAALSAGRNRIMEALRGCRVKYVDVAGAQQIRNINTMEDYWEFVKREKR